MESLVLDIDWDIAFSDQVPRNRLGMEYKIWDSRYLVSFPINGTKIGLPTGLIAGQNIMRLLSGLTVPMQRTLDFQDLPIPFTCVATDITNGKAVVLKNGFLADALRASMAIPTMFTAVTIDGQLLVDGGLARVLPAEDAIDLGADIVIGVDVGEKPLDEDKLNSILTMTRQSLNLFMAPELERQRAMCNIVISPEVHDFELYEFGQAPRLIAKGEEAARELMPQLEQLADSLSRWGPVNPPARPGREESFYFDEIVVKGLSGVSRDIVDKQFGIEIPGRATIETIEKGIDRIYATQHFQTVTYGIEHIDNGLRLVLNVIEEKKNSLRAGLRYDSRRKGGLLLNLTFRDLTGLKMTAALDVALEEEYEVDAKLFMHTGLLRSLGLRLRANTHRINMNVYSGEQRVAQYITRYTYGEFLLGSIFSTKLNVAAGIRAEYIDQKLETGPLVYSDYTDVLLPFFGEIILDTVNRTVFPSHGLFVKLSAEITDQGVGSDVSFNRFYVDERMALALHRKVSLLQTLFLGGSNGDVPRSYLYYLGGADEAIALQSIRATFFGLEYQERAGPYVQMFMLGVQYEFLPKFFLQAGWTIGNTFDEWNTKLAMDRYINGAGLTAGLNTFAGPIIFTIMTGERHDILTYFSAGYNF
jgi:NTE family protein